MVLYRDSEMKSHRIHRTNDIFAYLLPSKSSKCKVNIPVPWIRHGNEFITVLQFCRRNDRMAPAVAGVKGGPGGTNGCLTCKMGGLSTEPAGIDGENLGWKNFDLCFVLFCFAANKKTAKSLAI